MEDEYSNTLQILIHTFHLVITRAPWTHLRAACRLYCVCVQCLRLPHASEALHAHAEPVTADVTIRLHDTQQ